MQLLEELKTQIQIHIDLCDSHLTPILCAERSHPTRRIKLVDEIAIRVVEGSITIKAAMLDIERAFNDNLIDD